MQTMSAMGQNNQTGVIGGKGQIKKCMKWAFWVGF